ncbi:aminodeoxychorismate lyase [Isoalcanivorax indicus]|uniref:aminodeoxychorismate lyase n=1 Tax=Isoalcanivorax indicus TaxID=2202653 RepID=UPI001FE7C98C|nr:aminodeoxychorismate lyase [Isoalcanivorax indicus]
MTELVWQQLPADDRGLAYGDGCFETLRLTPGAAPLWSRHRARLLAGASRLGIPLSADELDMALVSALGRASESGAEVLKLILTRGSGGRGYAWPEAMVPRLVASLHPRPVRSPHDYTDGIVAGLCQQRLALQPAFAGLKHLNRLEQVMARHEVQQAGWQEGLMCDTRGRPVEFTSMNLFAVVAGELWTPPVTECGVAGVARGLILEDLAPALGLSTQVTARPLSQLDAATEVFACNSVAGILPVRKLAQWVWPVGEITRSIQGRLEQRFE